VEVGSDDEVDSVELAVGRAGNATVSVGSSTSSDTVGAFLSEEGEWRLGRRGVEDLEGLDWKGNFVWIGPEGGCLRECLIPSLRVAAAL